MGINVANEIQGKCEVVHIEAKNPNNKYMLMYLSRMHAKGQTYWITNVTAVSPALYICVHAVHLVEFGTIDKGRGIPR